MTEAATVPRPSAWAPLRHRIFVALWVASFVSSLGSWMHIVAAGWLMTSLAGSAALVALLQAASALPGFVLALPGGALADVVDRRRLILVAQTAQLAVTGAIAAITLTDRMTPGLLLWLTVVLGAASTIGLPAFSAITQEVVPRGELPAAISLNSIVGTGTQALGPAVGGLVVAAAGPGAVFALNAASFVAVVIVIAAWHREQAIAGLPPEHVLAAIRTGVRYVANAPAILAILTRAFCYVLAYSALPALLVVVVRNELGGSAGQYGLLLGLSGCGGVTAGLLLPTVRRRMSSDTLVAAATSVAAAMLAVVGVAPNLVVVAVVLMVLGVANIVTISTISIALQMALPAWMRGRGLAAFQLVFQASFAIGAGAWGALAQQASIGTALAVAAVILAATATLAPFLRLSQADATHPDLAPVVVDRHESLLDLDDGPLMVIVQYCVPDERRDAFRGEMAELRRARRREGATSWGLWNDPADTDHFTESFVHGSLAEHRRTSERRTTDDQAVIDRVESHSVRPVTQRMLAAQRINR
jgi:MFS family permease